MSQKLCAATMLLALCGAASAAEPPPLFGRYMPLYPGLYATAGYGSDDRDSSFDANGDEQPTALPAYGGETRLPQQFGFADFSWHFPLFQSQGVPLISSMPFTARVGVSYSSNKTEGALAAFATDTGDDAGSAADELEINSAGIGDVRLQFGGFLVGSAASDKAPASRFSLLLMGGVTLPFGEYNRDAPVNSGGNAFSYELRLGANARLWPGAMLDAGIAQRRYSRNEDPAFGALEPAQRGDDVLMDLSIAQKLFDGLYLTAFATDRDGDPNRYDNPRFAPNPPEAPDGFPPSDNYPTPGSYHDEGTELRSYGVSLAYFITQRWLAAIHYTAPQSGRSGEYTLPFTDRSPAGCTIGSLGCQTSAGGSTRVDGLGDARAYASDRLMFTLSYNFWQGDNYSCPGCER